VRCIQVGGGTPCDGRSPRTSYDRVVAQCFVGGADVSVQMVERGSACDWTRFSGGTYSAGHPERQCP
jgi:endonuclease YncB( thermonuclease family)